MSASMIRRGLELLSDDIKGVRKDPRQTKKSAPRAGGSGVMDRISSNRQGVTRQVRKLQGHGGAGKSKATVKDKRIKSALEEYRKKQKKSQLSANLKYFLEKNYKTQDKDTQKILLQNSGRQSRHRADPVRKPKEEPKSLFTEDQFQQFQKEYFGKL